MDWLSATVGNDNAVKIPDRWLHLYYYEALNILFRFENALRLFVYVILKREFEDKWDLASLGDGITIKTETKKRIHQAREHGYLGYEVFSPMLFLNSGELTQIIVSDTYWKHFAPFFRASKAIVLTKLQEIGTVRNSIAHFRPIKQDDIDLIKQNSKHVLLGVEDCLVQLTSITDVVPTNSQDAWYKEIKPIGSEQWSTDVFSSHDQQWIRAQLTYRLPVLQKNMSKTYGSYKVGSIRTPQLLKLYPQLKQKCIYLSESDVFAQMVENLDLRAEKTFSFVFSRNKLEEDLTEIASALKEVALRVDSETALITQDSLARGELVESKLISASHKEYSGNWYWTFNADSLLSPISEIDEVEYWGKRWNFTTDFVCSTANYPWMPSSVSADEFPF